MASRYGVSRQTVCRWKNQLEFPRPVKFSSNCTRWKLSDIEAWEASKVEVPA
ncbi:MAG: AlpA family phage regulatory protein [Pseudomonadota bacterium]